MGTFQNTTHVAFKVENTFGNMVSSVFTEYHSGSFGETECLEEENVEQNSQVETEFIAQCMHHAKISVLNIWLTDCSDATPFNTLSSCLVSLLVPTTKSLSFQSPMLLSPILFLLQSAVINSDNLTNTALAMKEGHVETLP